MPIYAFVLTGIASWFYPIESVPSIQASTPYVCAMNIEPPGTQIEVENIENGRSSHCIVTGSGPFIPGRVLDVSPAARDELGFYGLASVRIYKISGYLPRCYHETPPQTCKAPPPHLCVLDLPKPVIVRC